MLLVSRQVVAHHHQLLVAPAAVRYTHRASAGAAAAKSSSSSWFSAEQWFTESAFDDSSSSAVYRYNSTVASKWSNSALAGPSVEPDFYGQSSSTATTTTSRRRTVHQQSTAARQDMHHETPFMLQVDERSWLLQDKNSSSSFWSRWFFSSFSSTTQQQDDDNDDDHPLTLLPHTFRDALLEQSAAIVITTATAPHKVVHVNQAWTNLCGYTKPEAFDQDLSKLIQGPKSNTDTAAHMVKRLLETKQPQEAYLINYTKSQRQFTNHVAVGALSLHDDDPHHVDLLVGVLQEVNDEVPLRMIEEETGTA
jgi:PAS domain-containing protein